MPRNMFTIYHNPRCRKSRAGLTYLQEKSNDYRIREYLKEPLDVGELKDLINKLGMSPLELVRTQEEVYRKEYKGNELTDSEWVQVLISNPKLLQRPIVVKEHMAVLAQPPENIDKLL